MEAAWQKLIEQGILGVLLVIMMFVIAALFKEIKSLYVRRAEDAEKLTQALLETRSTMASMTRVLEQQTELIKMALYGRGGQ